MNKHRHTHCQNVHEKNNQSQTVQELIGQEGQEKQIQAFEYLGDHLYMVAVQYLWRRKNDVVYLSSLPAAQIEQYAEDFAQETLLKLTEDNFRRLGQYSGHGKFTSWAAQVVVNCIRDELRNCAWHRRTRVSDHVFRFWDPNPTTNPERQSISDMMGQRIRAHLAELPPKGRTAITRCLVDGVPVADVAEEMGLSVNALYIQLSRGKATLRDALKREGFTPEG